MKSGRPPHKRAYDRTGRIAEAMKVRSAIVTAAEDLLRTKRPEELSLAEVAKRSGASVRTVYRHFANPQQLVQAAAQAFIARLFVPLGTPADRLVELPAQLAHVQRVLSEEPSRYRLFFNLPARSTFEMAKRVQSWAGEALARIPPEHHAAVSGLVELLASPYAWEVLHTHWQLPPERITRACLAAMQSMLDGLEHHPEWLSPSRPLPPRFQQPPTERAGRPHAKPRTRSPR